MMNGIFFISKFKLTKYPTFLTKYLIIIYFSAYNWMSHVRICAYLSKIDEKGRIVQGLAFKFSPPCMHVHWRRRKSSSLLSLKVKNQFFVFIIRSKSENCEEWQIKFSNTSSCDSNQFLARSSCNVMNLQKESFLLLLLLANR